MESNLAEDGPGIPRGEKDRCMNCSGFFNSTKHQMTCVAPTLKDPLKEAVRTFLEDWDRWADNSTIKADMDAMRAALR